MVRPSAPRAYDLPQLPTYNIPIKARPAPMAAIGSAVAAAMPSESVVEAPVCAAEPADEPVVRALVVWVPDELSSLSSLEEPVASGSFRADVTEAKSRP